jgi:tetratricopeptide (TPR) repeat protein
MEIVELIKHPERLDRDTLYELRSLLALYPYYQTARLLLLRNLYLLHDPTFDEELRRAAIYITDRRVLFDMIEAAHYKHPSYITQANQTNKVSPSGSRTISLIDNFLDSIPKEEAPAEKKRKPTPADAAVDYVAYLMEVEPESQSMPGEIPQMPGQELIDSFINIDKGKFSLSDVPLPESEVDPEPENTSEGVEEEYFTETLARIYIKQGRYSKALEIIQRLSLQVPKKNAYFADQIRFLEKLIINSNK